MRLARHEQRTLRRIDRMLTRSEPRLHSEFRAFGKVCSGQTMPGWEQLRTGWWAGRRRRLSHSVFTALAYAGGIVWLPDEVDDLAGEQARKW
jgi:hypothetical protein